MGENILTLSLYYLNRDTYHDCNIPCTFSQDFEIVNGKVDFCGKASTREFAHAHRGSWQATKKNKAAIETQYGKTILEMCAEFAATGEKPTHPTPYKPCP